MSQGRYSQRGWAFQSWAFRTWGLAGDADASAGNPTDGWVARESSRTVTGGLNRVVPSPEMNRVVVAYLEGRCHGMR